MNKFPLATSRYSMAQALYWTSYCMMVGFAAVYLLAKHYNNSEIGVILAIVNILAMFLQPAMAAFIDRTSRISLKNFICVLGSVILILSLLILFIGDIKYTAVIFIVLAFGILISMQPLITAICFAYEKAGIKINYGIARGIGSGAYAVTSIVLGTVIDRLGAGLLPVYYIVALILLLSILLSFRPRKTEEKQSQRAEFSAEQKTESLKNKKDLTVSGSVSVLAFFKKYKTFSIFIAGSSLVFFSHFLINTFMIQIMYGIGGGTAQMGTSVFIAAMMEIPIMFVFNWLKEKVSCAALLKITAIVFTAKHLLAFLSVSVPMFYLTQLLQIGGYGLYIPASVYYANQIMDNKDLIKGQAMVTGAITLGNILASLIGGILLDHFNAQSMLFAGIIVSTAGSIFMLFSIKSAKKKAVDIALGKYII
jgi:Major Facilitator Superfamily.